MFTGIVEEIGTVKAINRISEGMSLRVYTDMVCHDTKLGGSIAVNGVCLSVTGIEKKIVSFDVIHETLKRTSLGALKVNDKVNLERSLKLNSGLDGHFVSGHIDYKARIERIIKGADGTGFEISLPDEFAKFVVQKGSIAVDGVSLTVAEAAKITFTVYLIPHTLKLTTFGAKKKGDLVNIETDLLAKYISKQAQKPDLQGLLNKYQYV